MEILNQRWIAVVVAVAAFAVRAAAQPVVVTGTGDPNIEDAESPKSVTGVWQKPSPQPVTCAGLLSIKSACFHRLFLADDHLGNWQP